MDQQKIGAFMAACRKRKKLTQRQLAEALGVTDRSFPTGKMAFVCRTQACTIPFATSCKFPSKNSSPVIFSRRDRSKMRRTATCCTCWNAGCMMPPPKRSALTNFSIP